MPSPATNAPMRSWRMPAWAERALVAVSVRAAWRRAADLVVGAAGARSGQAGDGGQGRCPCPPVAVRGTFWRADATARWLGVAATEEKLTSLRVSSRETSVAS